MNSSAAVGRDCFLGESFLFCTVMTFLRTWDGVSESRDGYVVWIVSDVVHRKCFLPRAAGQIFCEKIWLMPSAVPQLSSEAEVRYQCS